MTNPIYLRAGGRRRINAARRRAADERRARILEFLLFEAEMPIDIRFTRGQTAAVAKRFGISRTTAWRDVGLLIFGPRSVRYHDNDNRTLFVAEKDRDDCPVRRVVTPDGKEYLGLGATAFLRRWNIDRFGRRMK